MDFLWKWFNRGGKPRPDDAFSDAQKALIHSAARPAIRLEPGGDSFSRLGGLPDLPEDMDWPRDETGKPLSFLAQIDLTALPPVAKAMGLPDKGALWFFYAQHQEAWGFDPKDRLTWRVLYSDQSPDEVRERWAPDGLLKSYRSVPLCFSEIETFPDLDVIKATGLDCPDARLELYLEHVSPDTDSRHIMGGYCDAMQDPDMPLQCQLVSNGIYCGGPSAFKSTEAKALAAGAKDWRLLLQLESEDEARMMWGDGGMLYFWIREDDLKAARFDRVWMILQCG